jgi:hypothetical protein
MCILISGKQNKFNSYSRDFYYLAHIATSAIKKLSSSLLISIMKQSKLPMLYFQLAQDHCQHKKHYL